MAVSEVGANAAISNPETFAAALEAVTRTERLLPQTAAMYEHAALGLVSWLGAAVWAVGFGFEAVGDAQLRRFRADPANAGKVLDRGLWRYTRHPNYFGDAMVWFGLWLLACSHWIGLILVACPLVHDEHAGQAHG